MLLVLIKRELRRVFTDRRLVFSTFILPAISIYLIYSIMGSMLGNMIDDIETHDAVVYVYQAPDSFIEYSKSSGIVENMKIEDKKTLDGLESSKEYLKSGDIDLLVVFPEDFDKTINNYDKDIIQAEIQTYYNPSKDYSRGARRQFVGTLLNGYEDNILEKRFGESAYAKPFVIDITNKENEVIDINKATGEGLSMILPMLIAILLFAGAMGIGLDTIAGEKERGTMTSLLLTPVNREIIALGKVIGLAIVAIISAITSFIAIIASLPKAGAILGGGEDISISSLSFGVVDSIQLLIIMLTLVGIYVGLICIVSVRASSVKEAGTYIAPIYMLVMTAAFSTMFTTGEPVIYQFAIPILGNVLAIKQLLTFELDIYEFSIVSGVSILVTAILIWGITRSFKNEKVMLDA